jgi:CheY-like chemotaxis protein
MDQILLTPTLTSVFSQLYCDLKDKKSEWQSNLLVLMSLLGDKALHIVLADDDEDDRDLFTEAMHEIAPNVRITTVVNGSKLMSKLNGTGELPDVIFLDLNMPQKNGIECLEELRGSDKYRNIPVVIYSTSASHHQIEQTYNSGANLYIQKPQHFEGIKTLLRKMLSLDPQEYLPRPARSKFVMHDAS